VSAAPFTRRTAVRAAALGLPGALLAACSGQPAAQAPAANTPPVTLSFLSWRPPAMDQFAPSWQEYGQKHNVTITVDKDGDYDQTKLTTMIVSDTGPDLFDSETQHLPKMYDSGFVLELTKYLSRDKITLDKDWGVLGIERWRQKTFGVPYWVEPFGIYYNKSLFKKRGVEDPWERSTNKGAWTLEEMVEAARKINDPANDVWGLDWGPSDAYAMGPLIWTLGVSHMQYDPQIAWQLTLPEVTQAFGWATDWLMKLVIDVRSPLDQPTASRDRIQAGRKGIGSGGVNLFSQGNIGIHFRSVNDWRRMQPGGPAPISAFDWDILPVPSIKGKPGGSYAAGHPVCAWAKTKHPDESWAFMNWLMNDEFQGVLAENQFLVPAKKKFQPRFYRPPEAYKYQHPQVFADVFKHPYGIIFAHYNAAQNVGDFNAAALKMIKGEVPLQGGLADLQGVLNKGIEYGGGENPFKGVRWPIQPKG
jgi:ABC-type glycerol-3-phosphate transport system substrate-binding protein